MPRTPYPSHEASTTAIFQLRAYRISTSNQGVSVSIATISSKPQKENALRRPLVEHRFEQWLQFQPFIHDCDVLYRGTHFRIFFQRHKRLPKNPYFQFNGDLVIMRLGTKVSGIVVNLRSGDQRLAHQVAKRFAPYLIQFQSPRRRRINRLIKL